MIFTIINGPNLNLVGTRQSNIYGTVSMDEFLSRLTERYPDVKFVFRQSNVEGEIVNYIQEAAATDGIILNAGGYTHTSVAIPDAVSSVSVPTVEVHISNILAREPERHVSLLSKTVIGSIMGFGLES
ncbi:MAG: 3-dehydroquinate dehydratase, partial [bacterium]|nr:3-dehydroquinate dehydratase [Candidatus Minthenecus merdequi]